MCGAHHLRRLSVPISGTALEYANRSLRLAGIGLALRHLAACTAARNNPPQRAGRRRAVRRASLSASVGTKNASQGRRNKNRPLSRLAAPTAFRHEASNSSSNQQVDWMADKEVIMDD